MTSVCNRDHMPMGGDHMSIQRDQMPIARKGIHDHRTGTREHIGYHMLIRGGQISIGEGHMPKEGNCKPTGGTTCP